MYCFYIHVNQTVNHRFLPFSMDWIVSKMEGKQKKHKRNEANKVKRDKKNKAAKRKKMTETNSIQRERNIRWI